MYITNKGYLLVVHVIDNIFLLQLYFHKYLDFGSEKHWISNLNAMLVMRGKHGVVRRFVDQIPSPLPAIAQVYCRWIGF